MKRFVLILSLVTICGLSEVNAQKTEVASESSGGKEVKLKITGLTCAGCNSHLSTLLSETPGIIDNSVAYPGDIAVIQYDPEKVKADEIITIIEEKTSYKAEVQKEKPKSKS